MKTTLAFRKGASAVEMAVVLPVLLLLGIGCVETGRAIAAHAGLANAARAGADWAATHRVTSFTRDAWEAQIRQEVEGELQSVPGIRPADVQLDVETTTEPDGGIRVRVSVAQVYQSLVAWPLLPQQLPLERSLVVRQYQ
jgi:Flp pilus assembly protein TadG